MVIMSLSGWSQLHDPNAPLFEVPILAGAALYATAFAFATFYNFRATRSVMLALHHVAAVCCIGFDIMVCEMDR